MVTAWAISGLADGARADDSQADDAFLSAVWAGDVAGARRYLKNGADLGAIDGSGLNAVEIAETLGDSAMLILLAETADSPPVPAADPAASAPPAPEVATLPDPGETAPFDLTFSPATTDEEPIFERVQRPSRDALAETAAQVRAELAAAEAARQAAAEASPAQDANTPAPPSTAGDVPALTVADRVFGWFLGIFDGAEPTTAASNQPQDVERGRAVAETASISMTAEDNTDRATWTASTADAAETEALETSDGGSGWFAALFDWGRDTASLDAAPQTTVRRGELYAEQEPTAAPADSWTAVAVTRNARNRDDVAVATPAIELADLTPASVAQVDETEAVIEWQDAAQTSTETPAEALIETTVELPAAPVVAPEPELTFADLFSAAVSAGAEPAASEATPVADTAAKIAEEIALKDAEAAEPPVKTEAPATVAEPDTSVVIGRMFSDPYGGAIPAGTPVPIYDAATEAPPEPERKSGSREAVEAAVDAVQAGVPKIASATKSKPPPQPLIDTPLFDEQLAFTARAKLRDAPSSTNAAAVDDDDDKGLVIYIRGTVPSEKLYLGGDQRLGRAYGADGDPARACAMRRSGTTWICPEAALWPAEVAAAFARVQDDYVESIVRYDDASARQFRVSFPSSNYDRILAHFIERLGEPTGNPEIWSPVVGSAPQENRVARWIASEEDEHGLAVLEVRSIDDLRWMMPPDPDNGVVRLFYKGAKPIYSMVTNADLRLLEVRRIAAGDAIVR